MTLTLTMILIATILFWISIKVNIYADYYTISKGGIHHFARMIVPIGIVAIIPLSYVEDRELIILQVLSYPILRAGMFNPGLNKLRGLKPTYLGDGWFDRLHEPSAKGDDWFDKLHKPLARIEENTRFPALTFAYWFYFAMGLVLGFFKITW